MGTREESTPVKPSKPTSTNQETSATPSYPDWSSSMQAYYGAGATPPFFTSTVASPSPHPYLWGNQHPLMPPYGTPVPYPVLYPGGVYAHPNIAMAPGALQAPIVSDAKVPEGKDRNTNKKLNGPSANPGLVAVKAGESGKVTSGAESGSDSSSDGIDEHNHELSATKKGSFDQMLADGATAQNNTSVANFQNSVPGNPVVSVPATNLNIGMDLWNPSSAASGAMKLRPNPGVSPAVAPGMMTEQWVQVIISNYPIGSPVNLNLLLGEL